MEPSAAEALFHPEGLSDKALLTLLRDRLVPVPEGASRAQLCGLVAQHLRPKPQRRTRTRRRRPPSRTNGPQEPPRKRKKVDSKPPGRDPPRTEVSMAACRRDKSCAWSFRRRSTKPSLPDYAHSGIVSPLFPLSGTSIGEDRAC